MKRKATYEIPHIGPIYIEERHPLLAALSGETDDDTGKLPGGGDDDTGREGDAKPYTPYDPSAPYTPSLWTDPWE